jgi:hypothetical protein
MDICLLDCEREDASRDVVTMRRDDVGPSEPVLLYGKDID